MMNWLNVVATVWHLVTCVWCLVLAMHVCAFTASFAPHLYDCYACVGAFPMGDLASSKRKP